MASAEDTRPEPDLARFQQQLVLDRHLRDGLALAEVLRIGVGDRVLELGCGTGLIAERLGRRVGAQGDVLGLDALPLRVQVAHQRCDQPNVRFQIGRADDLDRFPAGCFSIVLAVNQVHRWVDLDRVLAACRRVLAPGGRLGLVDAAAEPRHPVREVERQVRAQALYAEHPAPSEARTWPATASSLDAGLTQAGFDAVMVQALPDSVRHGSIDAAIEYVQATAWGEFLDDLPVHLRVLARADVVSRLSMRLIDGALVHEGVKLQAVAVLKG